MFCEDLYHNTTLCISCLSRDRWDGHYNCDICHGYHMAGRARGLFSAIKNKLSLDMANESWHRECWVIFGDLVLEFGLDN